MVAQGVTAEGPARRPPRRRRRKSARLMLALGLAAPRQRAASLDDQILHAVANLGAATEREILELIARDRWHFAHKTIVRMVQEGILVRDMPSHEDELQSEPLVATVLAVHVATPVSAVAKVVPESEPVAVRLVAFGAKARDLLALEPHQTAQFAVRWLRRRGRRSAKVLGVATRVSFR
jgi:hypothetical protein